MKILLFGRITLEKEIALILTKEILEVPASDFSDFSSYEYFSA